jgi:hypothetical protein
MPRDTLRIISISARVDRNTFLSIIQAQHQLNEIDVGLAENIGDAVCIKPYLTNVSTLSMRVSSTIKAAAACYANYLAVIRDCGRISNLKICIEREDDEAHTDQQVFANIQKISLSTVCDAAKQLNVTELDLTRVLLGDFQAKLLIIST